VFLPEWILIPHPSLRPYLCLGLAQDLGVTAHFQFCTFSEFFLQVYQQLLPESSEIAMDASKLPWLLMKHLPSFFKNSSLHRDPSFFREEDLSNDFELFQHCEEFALFFESVALEESKLFSQWEKTPPVRPKKKASFLQAFWQDLRESASFPLKQDLFNFFKKNSQQCFSLLPERLFFFGFQTLPPFYLEVLRWLSSSRTLFLFLRTSTSASPVSKDLRPFQKNRLADSWGRGNQEFLKAYAELFQIQGKIEEKSLPPQKKKKSLLQELQHDLLSGQETVSTWKRSKKESSIQIHACPNELREIEILQNQLLWLFEEMEDLKPWEVAVMVSDLDHYLPYIKAVFGEQGANASFYLPYSLLDESYLAESPFLQAFLKLIEFPRCRFSASEVLDLLESTPIARHFDISKEELKLFRGWIRDSGIRWGLNAGHRKSLGLPEMPENTWESGLSRLLLGYLMGDPSHLFEKNLPFQEISTSEALSLGKLLEFIDRLKKGMETLKKPKSLTLWAQELQELVRIFLSEEEENSSSGLKTLFPLLQELYALQTQIQYNAPVSLELICYFLKKSLEKSAPNYNLFSGGITFGLLSTLHTLPYRVVYLVGLNADLFPRLLQRKGRPLCASLLDNEADFLETLSESPESLDDPFLFLSAILTAEEKFFCSYVSQDTQHYTQREPSSVLTELSEYLLNAPSIDLPPLFIQHPLESYHGSYFKKEAIAPNYSDENFEAFLCLTQQKESLSPSFPSFFSNPLPPPTEQENNRRLSLKQLSRFF
jgi:exodeoxyribonuclease V gamma subunit